MPGNQPSTGFQRMRNSAPANSPRVAIGARFFKRLPLKPLVRCRDGVAPFLPSNSDETWRPSIRQVAPLHPATAICMPVAKPKKAPLRPRAELPPAAIGLSARARPKRRHQECPLSLSSQATGSFLLEISPLDPFELDLETRFSKCPP